MAKPPAKKRPYDAMYDESSRAITAMPYTEKPKPKAKAAPKKPAPKSRPYDAVKDEPTSRPFKRGGKVVRKADGGLSKLLTPKRLRGRDGPSDTLAATPKMDTEGLRGMPSIDSSKLDTTPKSPSSSQTFSDAFRAARNRGDKTFSWKGKSFTTAMAGESSAPAKKASSAAKPAAKPAPKAARAPRQDSPPPAKKPSLLSQMLSGGEATAKRREIAGQRQREADAESAVKGKPKSLSEAFARDRERELKRRGITTETKKAKGGKVKAKKRYV